MESPDLRVTCVDLNGRDWQNSSCVDLSPWLCAEAALVHRSTVLAARLGRHDLKPTWPLALHMPSRGSLKNLSPIPQKPGCSGRWQLIFCCCLQLMCRVCSSQEGQACSAERRSGSSRGSHRFELPGRTQRCLAQSISCRNDFVPA